MTIRQERLPSATPILPDDPSPAGKSAASSSINISPVERWGRVAVGVAGIIVGIVLLVAATTAVAVVLELLLIAAGLDMLITGARGHCPLYARLGHVPRSLRGSR